LSDNIKAMSPNFDAAIRALNHIRHLGQFSRLVARERLRAECQAQGLLEQPTFENGVGAATDRASPGNANLSIA
jgi:hypothetical protein